MSDSTVFLRGALRNFVTVSSVVPTSEHSLRLIDAMIDGSRRRVVVEYGPGTGGLARMLLRPGKLTDDSVVILLEKTAEFASHLQATLTDPRVRIFHESAEHVEEVLARCGEERVDYVLSSIPLTIMSNEVRTAILRATRNVLGSEGVFIVYLFRRRIVRYLRDHFDHVTTRTAWLNVPPLIVCEAKNASDIAS